MAKTPDKALIWAVHRTQDWWKHIGETMGFSEATVFTDRRGYGDRWITGDFYAAYRRLGRGEGAAADLLSDAELADVIARCRVLRWLPESKARRMALAMAQAAERLLDATGPDVFLCRPIDSYVSDVVARRARVRGVPTFEATASPLDRMTMLMHRGQLMRVDGDPDPVQLDAKVHELADPLFTPSYVQGLTAYTRARFLKTLGYFRLRSAAFGTWRHLARDPLRCHLLDAHPGLGHKARLSDIRITRMIDADWQVRIAGVPRERRVFFGLQLIPEAAIDYWIEDLRLVRHEDMLVELARHLTGAGYTLVIKDHPLQFGFRQVGLLDALKALPNTVLVPYGVSGNTLLAECAASVTATGTLGLQAAMIGNASVVGEAYYTTPEDFLITRSWEDLAGIPGRIARWSPPDALETRQRRIVSELLRGSFEANFISHAGFDRRNPHPDVTQFGRALGEQVRRLGPTGEDWHRRHMPAGGGRWPGSPLN